MHKLKIISFLIYIFYFSISYGQGGEVAQTNQLIILNGLKTKLLAAQKAGDKVRIEKISEQIALAEKTMKTTEKIYEHYQNTLKAVETVSSTIKTSIEVKEFWEYALEACDIYSKHGIAFKFTSLYDLDKYVNPSEHEKYARLIEDLYHSVMDDVEDIKLLTGTSANKLYVDKRIIKATEYERWTEVGKVISGTRKKIYLMRRIVMTMQYLAPSKNKDIHSNIEIKKSLYNIDTYAR